MITALPMSTSYRHFGKSVPGLAAAYAENLSHAAALLLARRRGACFGGGSSRSADTRKRARSRCTIAMLSPFFPRRTSLTRLGVPRIGTHVASREAVLIHEVTNGIRRSRRPARPFALFIGGNQTGLRLQSRNIGRVIRVP